MSWKNKYDIEFKGLKEGLHEFKFEVDNKFFAHFEESLVENGEITIHVVFEKRSSFMKLHFNITGWLELTCDRCLENYQQTIFNEAEMFVKFAEKEFDDGENIIWINPDEYHINLAHFIYEYVSLSIPMRHVHPKKKDGKRDCNQEMIDKLKNYMHPESGDKTITDPRWDTLRKFGNIN